MKIKKSIVSKSDIIKEREKLTVKDLLNSRELVARLNQHARSITRGTSVTLTDNDNICPTAFTNGKKITININNKLIKGLPLDLLIMAIDGIHAHELGHILYTNFSLSNKFFEDLLDGEWKVLNVSPKTPKEERAWNEIQDFVARKKIITISSVIHELFNIVEDAHLEPRMMENFHGWIDNGLSYLREIQSTRTYTVDYYIEMAKEHAFKKGYPFYALDIDTFLNVLLGYAKYAILDYENAPESLVYVNKINEIDDIIQEAVLSRNCKTRSEAAVRILLNVWEESGLKNLAEKDILLDDILAMNPFVSVAPTGSSVGKQGEGSCSAVYVNPSKSNNESNNESESKSDDESDDKSDVKANGKSGDKSNDESGDESNDKSGSSTGKSDDESNDKANRGSGDKSNDESGDESGGESPNFPSGGESFDGKASSEKAKSQNEIAPPTINQVSTKEGGRISYDEKGKATSPNNEETWENVDIDGGEYADNTASDIIRLLNKIAESKASEKIEEERLKEMGKFIRSMDFSKVGAAHRNCHYKVHRIPTVPDSLIQAHNKIQAEYMPVADIMSKKFIKLLEPKRKRGYQTNLYMGQKLNTRSFYKNDGRVFKKKNVNDKRNAAIAILVDESGSMSYNERSTVARLTALTLHEALEKANIPHMIVGHDESGWSSPNVNFYSYVEFDSTDGMDKYRLMNISSRDCNRDGAALMYVCQRLEKRPELSKIVIVISDGQPSGDNYSGKSAIEDLRSIKGFYSKRGLHIFAAAIGEDKDAIHNCYGDGFIDVSNLNNLLNVMFNIISKYIR